MKKPSHILVAGGAILADLSSITYLEKKTYYFN